MKKVSESNMRAVLMKAPLTFCVNTNEKIDRIYEENKKLQSRHLI